MLYRSDITRKTSSFFPNLGPHGDTSTFYKYLDSCDFGFVHQVLSYERIHEKAMSSRGIKIDTYRSAYLDDLIEYGPKYLTNNELKNRISARMNDYYDSLASGFVNFKDKEYWEYHKNRLYQLGLPFSYSKFYMHLCLKLMDLALNPKQSIKKLVNAYSQSISILGRKIHVK